MKKLKMAIIGAGQITRTTHLPCYLAMPEVEVVAVCDTNLLVAKEMSNDFNIPQYFDNYQELLQKVKPDAVTVCVPNQFHHDIVIEALSEKCHVLCEKPPAISAEQAKNMDRVSKEQNRLLSYGFHFRHSENVRMLKQFIKDNKFGHIYNAKVQWHRRRGIPGWGNFTNRSVQGGGPLIDIGSHMLDIALYLLDYPQIAYVAAAVSDRIGKKGGVGFLGEWNGEKFTTEDSLFGFVQFANGDSLNIETSFAINIKEKDIRNVFIYGEDLGASVFPLELYGEEMGQQYNKEFPFINIRDWHKDCNQNFVDACLNKEQLLVTGEQGSYVQTLIEMLYQSAYQRKPVFCC